MLGKLVFQIRRGDGIRVEAGAGQELACVFSLIDAGRLEKRYHRT